MKYLHTMVRAADLKSSLAFYCDALGLHEVRRMEHEKGRFTLVFLAAPGDETAQIELTYNWDAGSRMRAAAISGMWPTRWMISMRPANAS